MRKCVLWIIMGIVGQLETEVCKCSATVLEMTAQGNTKKVSLDYLKLTLVLIEFRELRCDLI